MEPLITAYITHELIGKPKLGLKNDTPLFESGLLSSLSLVKLVLFLEKQFHVVVRPEELLPKNFHTIDAICTYLRSKQGT
jgi:acyl carrier protein